MDVPNEIIKLQAEKISRLMPPQAMTFVGNVAFEFSPIPAERESQEKALKDIFGPQWPNSAESWQFLNTMIVYVQRYLQQNQLTNK